MTALSWVSSCNIPTQFTVSPHIGYVNDNNSSFNPLLDFTDLYNFRVFVIENFCIMPLCASVMLELQVFHLTEKKDYIRYEFS